MNFRQNIRDRLDNVMKRPVTTGWPHNEQMRELSALNAETMLQVLDTLDKMDNTNKKLHKSNVKLAHSNLKLQRVAIGIAITGVVIAIIFGVLTFYIEKCMH